MRSIRGVGGPARRRALALASLALALSGLIYATLAGGTQPYEAYESTVARDAPVAQFRFDDPAGSTTLSDSVGSGTYTAANTAIALGGEGPFDGSKSGSLTGEAFATLPSNPLAGASDFTAEAWVKWSGGTVRKQPIFEIGSGSGSYMYLTPASAASKNPMTFEIHTATGSALVTATKLAANAWEYLAVSESAGTLTLYLNGKEAGHTTGVTLTPASLEGGLKAYLGKSVIAGEPYFGGSLSNVGFYNKALTGTQIAEHYDAAEAPSNTSPPTIPVAPREAVTDTATEGTWTGLTPLKFTFQWALCDMAGEECANIAAATKVSFKPVAADVGRTLRIAVTASNSAGSSLSSSAPSAPVEGKPTKATLPVISGAVKVGLTLAASPGTWTGYPPPGFSYQWESCTATGKSCVPIGGATGSSFMVTSAQVGHTLRVIVTAKNSVGEASSTSAASEKATTGPPVNVEAPTISGVAEDGQTLTGHLGSWAGTEPISYTSQWQRCNHAGGECANVAGATGETIKLGAGDVGKTFVFLVTAKNSVGSTPASSPASEPIAPSPPSNVEAPVVSGTPQDGQTLTAGTGTWSGTPPLEYAYQWQRCESSGGSCEEIAGATGSSVLLGHSEVGKTIRVLVTATNAAGHATTSSTPTAAVTPSAPSNVEAPVVSGTAQDGQTLTAGTGTWSGTPPLEYAYQWQRCEASGGSCEEIAGETGSSVLLGHSEVGKTIRVLVTATNTAGHAAASSATTERVAPEPPANVQAPSISGVAEAGQTLTAAEGTWSGTPPLTYAFQWQGCDAFGESCLDIAGATSSTYTPSAVEDGDTVRVIVSATNAGGTVAAPSAVTAPVAAGSHGPRQLVFAAAFGSEGSGAGQFRRPGDVAFDSHGDMWVLDSGNDRVEEFTPSGEFIRQFGSQGSAPGELSDPSGIAIDAADDVWVADTENARVEEFNGEGDYLKSLGSETGPEHLVLPEGLAIDAHGDVWVSDTGEGSVVVFSPNGEYLKTVGTRGSEAGQIGEPEGISVTPNGRVWVADWSNSRVEEFEESGRFVRQFGVEGGESGQIEHAYGIAADGSGDVWVAEPGNTRIQQFTETGEFVRVLASAGSRPGQVDFGFPVGLALDSGGDLWLADTINNRLEEWVPGTAEVPTNTAPPTIEGTPVVGQTLQAAPGSWSGTPPLEYLYQWLRCDGAGEACTSIPEATRPTYVTTASDIGSTLRVTVTAENEQGAASSTSQATTVVSAAPPTNTAPPSISGGAHEGGALRASSGSWEGTPPITFTYQWLACDSLGESCMPVAGATGATFTLEAGTQGDTFEVAVTATNAKGSATSTSAPSAIVSARPGTLVFSQEIPSTGSGEGQLASPGDVALDSAGDAWVLDTGNERIEEFSPEGRFLRQFGASGSGAGQFRAPDALALDPAGDVWVADTGNSRVEEFSGEGQYLQTIGEGELGGVEGIAVDRHGDIWVSKTYEGDLRVFDQHGVLLKTVGSRGAGPGQFQEPEGIAIDRNGDVWIADWADNRVEEYDEGGEFVRQFGGRGSTEGEISNPYGIAADGDGDVWLGEDGNRRIQQFTEAGEPVTVLAPAGVEPGEVRLGVPSGLAASVSGAVWAADARNGRVEEWVPGTPEAPSNLTRPTVAGIAEDGHTLTASAGTWKGTPPIAYGYQWQRCSSSGESCESISGAIDPSYTASGADIASTLRVVVTAANQLGSSSSASEATGVVAPAPPTDRVAPTITGAAEVGHTLTASPGEWEGTAPISFAYQWERCEPSGEGCSDISEARGTTYVPDEADVGSTLRVRVTGTNSVGSASSISGATATVTAEAPANVVAPSIAGTAEVGQTLAADRGSWEGTAPISYAYQWESCDSLGEGCLPLAGATSSTLTLGESDAGETFEVLVTASNGAGTTTASSPPTAIVGALPPTNSAPPTLFGQAVVGRTLSASTGSWSGGQPLAYTYEWQVCEGGGECSSLVGATGSSYTLGSEQVGKSVRVIVTATNSVASAAATSSSSAAVASASPPSNTVPPTIAGITREGEVLMADAGTWAGTPAAYSYHWESCNPQGAECAEIEGAAAEGPAYLLGFGDLETTLRVIVTATNGAGSAQATSAPSPEIAAGPPSEREAPSITGATAVGESLVAHPGAWGEDVQIGYQWESCASDGQECAALPGATEPEYELGVGDIGTTLRLRIGASNPLGSVTDVSEPSRVVTAQTPTLVSSLGPSISGAARVGEALTADPGSWASAGEVGYAYQWERCDATGSVCAGIAGAQSASYTPSPEDAGDVLEVLITVSDEGESQAESAGTQPIASASAPAPEESPVLSGLALEGQTLTAIPEQWSGEGPFSYSYAWERCDGAGASCTPIAGATQSTYQLAAADVNLTIRAEVTATTAEGSSSAVSLPSPTVGAAGLSDVSGPSIGGIAQTGHLLTADPGIWRAPGAIAYAYQWQRCDASGEACAEIPGATDSTYTPAAQDLGSTLQVLVQATSGDEHIQATSPVTAAISSPTTAPENTAAPAIEGVFTAGDTVTAVPGSWAGAEPISYAYRWQRCDSSGRECTGISGASEASYVLTAADVGSTIEADQTASNSIGSTSAPSVHSEVVGAAGPPASSEGPAIDGVGKLGATLFVSNGAWTGSRPLSYFYRWERCNAAGEACSEIEGATKPSYKPVAVDIGATVRVRVTAENTLGAAAAVSAQTAITSGGEESAGGAIETAEATDPSILARSTSASLEEQAIRPGILDSGELLSSQSTLTGSTISKESPGEFAVSTPSGEVSLEPSGLAADAAKLPTIVNASAAVFAGAYNATDIVVRPEPRGASTLLQLRSAAAPRAYSWRLHVAPGQRLERLSGGSVALIEGGEGTGASGTEEGEQVLPGTPSTPTSPSGEHGVGGEAADSEREHALPEQGPTEVPPAPVVSTPETTPRPGELHPQETEPEFEAAGTALATAQAQASGTVLLVMAPPTVKDAAGGEVPASLSANDETVTLTISPAEQASYPLTAETAVSSTGSEGEGAGPHSQLRSLAAKRRSFTTAAVPYGLSDQTNPPFASLDPELQKGAPGGIKVTYARRIIPWNLEVNSKNPTWIEFEEWLTDVTADKLTPIVTFEAGFRPYGYCKKSNAKECEQKRPTEIAYEQAIEPIIKNVIEKESTITPVRYWGAWNEPDLVDHNGTADPFFESPAAVAKLWRRAQYVLHKVGCGGCKAIAGEFNTSKGDYVGKYRLTLSDERKVAVPPPPPPPAKPGETPPAPPAPYVPPLPSIWAMHDYDDLEYAYGSEGEHHNGEAEKFAAEVGKSVGSYVVWFSEQGILLERGKTLDVLVTAEQESHGKMQKITNPLTHKPYTPDQLQVRAADQFLTLGKTNMKGARVGLVDYYEYRSQTKQAVKEHGLSPFDSALLNAEGKGEAQYREAYCVIALGHHNGCKSENKTHAVLHTKITAHAAAVTGAVDPKGLPTEYWIEYGTTTEYGKTTPRTALTNETGEQAETVALSGLQPCTTYHYQMESENEGNEEEPSLGGDMTFKTTCEGRAVIEDPACAANTLPRNDDNSAGPVSLPFALDMGGHTYTSLYVNNNGNVTFDASLRQWTPEAFHSFNQPVIAAYFGDVDTRSAEGEGTGGGGGGGGGGTADFSSRLTPAAATAGGGNEEPASGVSGVVTYGSTTFQGRPAFCVDYPYVGYYHIHDDRRNDFQIMLVGRSDIAPGAFEIMFNYDQIQWETGDANGGHDGLGGNSAAVGYSAGNGVDAFEMPGSRVNGAFLDSNGNSGLIYGERNSTVLGRYVFDTFAG